MDLLKKNKKTIITIVFLIIAYLVMQFLGFGQDDTSVQEKNGIVSAASESGKDDVEENKLLNEASEETIKEKDEEAELEVVDDTNDTTELDREETAQHKETEEYNTASADQVEIVYKFRNKSLWIEHFEKHGSEFPYSTKEEYLEGANKMLANPNKLHKNEKEDGDDVYYLEETNEFIIVSLDGYIRTYFKPSRGKAYFDKQ